MADGSMHGLTMGIAESTYGSGFATNPALTAIRHTSCSLGLSKDFFSSEEIRSDRQMTDGIGGNRKVAGDIGIELSYGSFDTILEALLCGTWANNVLKGGKTRRSFPIERHFSDMDSAGKPYHRFVGCEFDKLALTIAANTMVKGTLSVVGRDLQAPATAALSGATYPEASATTPFSAFNGTLLEGGSAIGTVTELSMLIENGLAHRFVVADPLSLQPSIGRFHVSGTLTAYFDDSSLLEKFINETVSSISLTLDDAAGNALTFLIPRVKYTGGQPDVSGEGPVGPIAFPFEASLDSAVNDASLVITRDPA